MAELSRKQKQCIVVDPCENGWVVTVRDLLECVQGKQYAFTDRLALGDFVAEWYREPERVATNRVPFYDGGLNSEGV
jgi:hypothetical protein